jgi:hypothetical protein
MMCGSPRVGCVAQDSRKYAGGLSAGAEHIAGNAVHRANSVHFASGIVVDAELATTSLDLLWRDGTFGYLRQRGHDRPIAATASTAGGACELNTHLAALSKPNRALGVNDDF